MVGYMHLVLQKLLLYKAQIQPSVEYCSHLQAGAPKYQLLLFHSTQKMAVRIVDNYILTDSLEPLGLNF